MNGEVRFRARVLTRWTAGLAIAAGALACSPADDGGAVKAGGSGSTSTGGAAGSGAAGPTGTGGSSATGGDATGGSAGDSVGAGGSSSDTGGTAGTLGSGGSSGGAAGTDGIDAGHAGSSGSANDGGDTPRDSGSGADGGSEGGITVGPSGSDLNGGPTADKAGRMKCTGTSPIHCHADVPVGNYDISFVLGGSAAGKTAVDVECHRRLLTEVATAAGASKRYAFTVNVRKPEGEPVRPFQDNYPAGDVHFGTDGLDVYFSGGTPELDSFGYAPATQALVVYLAGDSTVTDQFQFPEFSGWGQMLAQHFHLGVSVANYADSGESSASFLSNSGLFPAIMKVIKANDYLLIQLGHNDKTISAADYHKNITSMVTQAKGKGAFPIIVTPIARATFTGSKLGPQHIHQDANGNTVNLPDILRTIAKEQSVPLIDLTATTSAWLEQVGPNGWQMYHATGDATHTNAAGSAINAKMVHDALQQLNIKPLVDYLR